MAYTGTLHKRQIPNVKRCKSCGVWYSDPATHFYRSKKLQDGLLPVCKKCHKLLRDLKTLPPPDDHECRRYSFIWDKQTQLYVCPICKRPYVEGDPWFIPEIPAKHPFPYSPMQFWQPWQPTSGSHYSTFPF